jgi:hypothetical protein
LLMQEGGEVVENSAVRNIGFGELGKKMKSLLSIGLLALVLGEFFRRELAGLHVALVEFRILLPLLGKVV